MKKVTLELTDEQLEEVKKIINVGKEFPKIGYEYWCIGHIGDLVSNIWLNDRYDNQRLSIGNVYSTEEEAQLQYDKLVAIQKVKTYIKKEFGYDSEKWGVWDDYTQKYMPCWNFQERGLDYMRNTYAKYYSPIGFLETPDQANQLIKDMKDELELIYK